MVKVDRGNGGWYKNGVAMRFVGGVTIHPVQPIV